MTELELLGKVKRCIDSAADNMKNRMPKEGINYGVLDDIEVDLAAALKATREIFDLRAKELVLKVGKGEA